MDIRIEPMGRHLVVRLTGDLCLFGQYDKQERLMNALSAPQIGGRIIFNMSQMTRLDTAAMGTLVRIVADWEKSGIKMTVVMPQGIPGQALSWLRVFEAWPCFQSEEDAFRRTGWESLERQTCSLA